MIDNIVRAAVAIARSAHSATGQVRKYTLEPYFNHCREVAAMVATAGLPDYAQAAANLHDTLEDTKLDPQIIADFCGQKCLDTVFMVTDVSGPLDGNRAARKQLDRDHLALASPEGKSVKLADLISNSRSIVQHDPNFAKTFLREMELLLPLLVDGEASLFRLAHKTLQEGQTALVQHKLGSMK